MEHDLTLLVSVVLSAVLPATNQVTSSKTSKYYFLKNYFDFEEVSLRS